MQLKNVWNNYKLIQWNNGTYGIRKGWIFHKYADLQVIGLWWGRLDCPQDIRGTLEKCLQVLDILQDKGYTVIENTVHR